VPSRYRLTFLGSLPDRIGPTDEWRQYVASKPNRNSGCPVPQPNVAGVHMVLSARRARGGTR
jgi:hypothetical protein